jgi:hypothetical protein
MPEDGHKPPPLAWQEYVMGAEQLDDEAFAERIAALSGYDTEIGHGRADDILCELLKNLGYVKTVAAFDALTKWYA